MRQEVVLGDNSLTFKRMTDKDAAELRDEQKEFKDPEPTMIEFDLVVRRYGRTLAVNGLTLDHSAGRAFRPAGPERRRQDDGDPPARRPAAARFGPGARLRRRLFAQAARGRRPVWATCPTSNTFTRSFPAASSWSSPAEMRGLDRAMVRDRIARESERFELAGFLDNLTETYSHGMRQRLVFAIAMLHDPQVLVVDEPMVGLDPRSARVVKDLLRAEAAAGKTVLMSTHTLAVAEEIADRIGILNWGRLDFLGTLAELRQELSAPHQALEHLFLELTNGHASLGDGISHDD